MQETKTRGCLSSLIQNTTRTHEEADLLFFSATGLPQQKKRFFRTLTDSLAPLVLAWELLSVTAQKAVEESKVFHVVGRPRKPPTAKMSTIPQNAPLFQVQEILVICAEISGNNTLSSIFLGVRFFCRVSRQQHRIRGLDMEDGRYVHAELYDLTNRLVETWNNIRTLSKN